MSQNPHDEFDDVPPYQSGEAGKHRAPVAAASGGGRGGLKWIALLAVVALAVGALSWLVLPTLRDSEPEASDETDEAAEEQADGGEDEGGEEGDGEDSGEDQNGGDEGTEGDDAPEDVAADTSAPVQVFSYQGPGQEQVLQDELETMGYNVTFVDEWGWGDIETPVVYYPAAAEEHAQDVAQNLGIETLIEDGANWSYVAVVVGPDSEG